MGLSMPVVQCDMDFEEKCIGTVGSWTQWGSLQVLPSGESEGFKRERGVRCQPLSQWEG